MLSPNNYLFINYRTQQLTLYKQGKEQFSCLVSTAKKGMGEKIGSGCTPRGWLIIREKIGAGQAVNSVFVARKTTGEILTETLFQQYPQRDWILTRILWLAGLELGKNRLGSVDTFARYIYLHACPASYPLGVPLSHGCIRLHNQAMLSVFNHVKQGTLVFIGKQTPEYGILS